MGVEGKPLMRWRRLILLKPLSFAPFVLAQEMAFANIYTADWVGKLDFSTFDVKLDGKTAGLVF